ncbi:FAD:protein FMN transferase [Luteitalea sp.]|uniref:FAD:protein FMN transferase n=1 Tax=Luteitalea sp. TaxID=2004800 RepID=UPI0025C599EC|nr:FAD:protein FMN transferase [Luteitalea sp.]
MRLLLATHAMATRFELVLHGDDPVHLRAAGEEALAEIARVDALLSAYRAESDIGRINHDAARQPVRVTAETCHVLRRCLGLARACDQAFDVTVGPLVRLWRAAGDTGRMPAPDALAAARGRVGAARVLVDADALTVSFSAPGLSLDLGAAGKGHAIDLAIAVLQDAGVTSALLHGGTSSVHTIGAPPEDPRGWWIGWDGPGGGVHLRDGALSVSAPHGRVFLVDGETLGHVVDPRTGRPVQRAGAAGVTGPSSFLCDALSTALLVHGAGWTETMRTRFPGYDGWAGEAS